MEMPRDWVKGTMPCQKCMKENVERQEKVYYGLVGNLTCSKCGLRICPIHYNHKHKVCTDCLEEDRIKEKDRN